ncbi:MAG: YbaN family protein [Planctomycetota bacterium]
MTRLDAENAAAPKRPPLNRAVRWALAALAAVSFAIGWIGIFVPGLPTTIFWLIAVVLATKSCPVIQRWVYQSGRPGQLVQQIIETRSLPKRAKHHAVLGLWLSLTLSMALLLYLLGPQHVLPYTLPLVGLGVTWFILRGLATADPTHH